MESAAAVRARLEKQKESKRPLSDRKGKLDSKFKGGRSTSTKEVKELKQYPKKQDVVKQKSAASHQLRPDTLNESKQRPLHQKVLEPRFEECFTSTQETKELKMWPKKISSDKKRSVASCQAQLQILRESNQRLLDQKGMLESKLEEVLSTSTQEIEVLKHQLMKLDCDKQALHAEMLSILAAHKLEGKKHRHQLSEIGDKVKQCQKFSSSLEQKITSADEEIDLKSERLEKTRQVRGQLQQEVKDYKQKLANANQSGQESDIRYLKMKMTLIGKQIDSITNRQIAEVLRMRHLLPKATEDSFPDRKFLCDCIQLWEKSIKELDVKKQMMLKEGNDLLRLIVQGRPLSCLPDLKISASELSEMTIIPFINIVVNTKEHNGTGSKRTSVSPSEVDPCTASLSPSPGNTNHAVPWSLFTDDRVYEKVDKTSIASSQVQKLATKLKNVVISDNDGAESATHPRLSHQLRSRSERHDIKCAVDEVQTKNNKRFLGISLKNILERELQLKLHARTGSASKAPWADVTQEGAAALPKGLKWKGLDCSGNSSDVCSICLEGFYGYKTLTLDCLHVFHNICIKDWLKIESSCPNCRSYSIVEEEYPPLSRK
ncbi:E3 ubiquitin-protein ligase TTC3-like isoform X2 [Macrobrachium rosenbergii]|uniref:E3 ubiquitin-protein ligase TTC3-like isoform X2 n=2 Tax=Macrobrachium rosenbergii TaxID=79674 RepID=UPI0034D7AEB0